MAWPWQRLQQEWRERQEQGLPGPGQGWGWGVPQQAGETLVLRDSGYCDRSEFTFCAPERFAVSRQAGDTPWVIRCLALLRPEETEAGCSAEGLQETPGQAMCSQTISRRGSGAQEQGLTGVCDPVSSQWGPEYILHQQLFRRLVVVLK